MASYLDNAPITVVAAEGRELIDVDGKRYLDAISSLWVNTLGHGVPELDAAVVEPLVQAAAGMAMAPDSGLDELTAACRRQGCLVIADEVATGFRTGTLFACEQAGLEPDLLCLGKGLTGGYLPLSATV